MTESFRAPDFRMEINGARLEPEVARSISDLRVESAPETLDQCTFSVVNPYPEMPWTHGDRASLFHEGNSLSVALGYVDNLHPIFDGEITAIAPSFPEEGIPSLQVTGRSRLHRLATGRKIRTFTAMTDAQIAERIATEAGLTPQTEATSVTHPYVLQNNETDLAFLLRRAAGLRYEVFVEGRTLHFRSARDTEGRLLTLVWGRTRSSFRPDANSFSLTSFHPTLEVQGQVSEVIVRAQDPLTRELVEGRASNGDEDVLMGAGPSGPQAAEQAFGQRSQWIVVDEPAATHAEAQARARALYNETAMDFITGSGTTVGLPQLRSGVVVELDGVGERFNGPYYVTSSTHTLDSGGYRTQFTVRRNAAG